MKRRFAPLAAVPGAAWDVLIAVPFVVLGVGQVLTKHDGGGPRWLVAPATFLMTAPIVLRRRAPLVGLAIFGATAIAQAYAGYTIPPDVAAVFLALLFLAFCVGAYAELRAAVAGLLFLWLVVGVVSYQQTHFLDNLLWVNAFCSAAWVAGLALNRRTRRTQELEVRAEVAEHEREQRAREAVAEERARIARELHDVVAHYVSVMVVQTSAVRRLLAPEQTRERETLVGVETVGRQALTEMRRLIGVLREQEDGGPALGPAPTMERVDELIQQVREAGLPVELTVEGNPKPLPAGIDLSAYRIVQEALTNTLKHAGPAHAEVHVRYADDHLELEIVDDGRGYGANGNGDDGHGLVGMRERVVSVCRGEFDAHRLPAGGFAVHAKLPYAEVAQ